MEVGEGVSGVVALVVVVVERSVEVWAPLEVGRPEVLVVFAVCVTEVSSW